MARWDAVIIRTGGLHEAAKLPRLQRLNAKSDHSRRAIVVGSKLQTLDQKRWHEHVMGVAK